MRFVSGGCDNFVKFWTISELSNSEDNKIHSAVNKLTCETGEGHGDWVRDVCWLNHVGLPYDIVASCGEVDYSYIG